MTGLLGKKIGMTQIFNDEGRQLAVTVICVGPCFVTGLRSKERDGYTAVQLGFDAGKESRFTKPRLGQFKKAETPALKFVREIRTENVEGLQVGAELRADNFQEGDFVDVTGTSIGRGYQGVIKRHGFKGGEKAHGTKHGRETGSIGQSAHPSRVIKGRKMPGQMGNERITVQNLKVVKVDAESNLIAVLGTVPGAEEAYLVVRKALKRGEPRGWKVPEKRSEGKPESEAGDEAIEDSKSPAEEPAQDSDKRADESKPETSQSKSE